MFLINFTSLANYEFRYETQYPKPPKHAIDASIAKWAMPTKKEPTHTDIEFIRSPLISKDKVKKLLGSFATTRLIQCC